MTNFELNDKEMDLVNGGYDSPTIEEDGKGKKKPLLPPKDASQRLY